MNQRKMALQCIHGCDQLLADLQGGNQMAAIVAREMIVSVLTNDPDGRALENLVVAVRNMAELSLQPEEEDSD